MTRKTRNSRINRKARNLIKSIRKSLRKIKNKSIRKSQKGGDGQMGHTVMTESYFGRDKIGFGDLENSPQQKGSGRLESMGHTHQEPTGWENAKSVCDTKLEGDVKFGGRRRRRRTRRRQSGKSCAKGRCSRRRTSSKRRSLRKR